MERDLESGEASAALPLLSSHPWSQLSHLLNGKTVPALPHNRGRGRRHDAHVGGALWPPNLILLSNPSVTEGMQASWCGLRLRY